MNVGIPPGGFHPRDCDIPDICHVHFPDDVAAAGKIECGRRLRIEALLLHLDVLSAFGDGFRPAPWNVLLFKGAIGIEVQNTVSRHHAVVRTIPPCAANRTAAEVRDAIVVDPVELMRMATQTNLYMAMLTEEHPKGIPILCHRVPTNRPVA